MRTEEDIIGKKEIPQAALYGIHAVRAKENFPDATPFHIEWFRAMGLVKLSVYASYSDFKSQVKEKYPDSNSYSLFDDAVLKVLLDSAKEVSEGRYFDSFIVPAFCGGAGTSINMNINEIIANAGILKLGGKPGDYSLIDPFDHANVFQSTNDVVPTALKLAVMQLLPYLEKAINDQRSGFETLEKKYKSTERIAYTQMQEAVPSTYGRLFSTYSDALSRDWWRVSKCLERIKVVNLGGGAVGTGLAIPKYFVLEAVRKLSQISGVPVTRGENLSDATANLDSLVEVHSMLKVHAVNLEKILNDIRLLAADISRSELRIPKRQSGSSIMPGKVNPVIVEFGIGLVHRVYANDQLITQLCANGTLDLNAYIPVIGHALLESLKSLINLNKTIAANLLSGIEIAQEKSRDSFFYSATLSTALIPYIGYKNAGILAKEMNDSGCSIFEANEKLKFVPAEKLKSILETGNLLKEGYLLSEL